MKGLEEQLEPLLSAKQWFVAFSGGVDSHILLILLQQYLQRQNLQHSPQLIAIHVNHQMQKAANDWSRHCRNTCQDLGIPCIIETITVEQGGNLEAKARDARYQAFSQHIDKGDQLFLAHHLNDQVETFFYRLFRGAGIKGLSAMLSQRPFHQGTLQRPLLSYSKQLLIQTANELNLIWVEDPSNNSGRFDRNWLRHQLIPSILTRFPKVLKNIERTISHLQEAELILSSIAQDDLQQCDVTFDTLWQESHLDLTKLAQLPKLRQTSALRYWLHQHGLRLTTSQMNVLKEQVITASIDSAACLSVEGKSIRKYQQRLYCCLLEHSALVERVSWQANSKLILEGFAKIQLREARDIVLEVKPREGGERCHLSGQRSSKSVKKLLQEKRVAPWHRECLPFVYHGDELLFVGDVIRTAAAERLLGIDNELLLNIDAHYKESS